MFSNPQEIGNYYDGLHDQLRPEDIRDSERPRPYSLHNGLTGGSVREGMNAWLATMDNQIIDAMGILPGHRVLEQGSGVGSVSLMMAKLEPRADFVATNVSNKQLKYGRKILLDRQQSGELGENLFLIGADYLMTPFEDGSFDRILFVDSISHAQDIRRVIGEAIRLLNPHGRLVIYDFFAHGGDDPQIDELRNIWLSPGIIETDNIDQIAAEEGRSAELINLSERVIPSLEYLAKKRIPTVAPGSMADGADLLYKLIEDEKVGYYQIVIE